MSRLIRLILAFCHIQHQLMLIDAIKKNPKPNRSNVCKFKNMLNAALKCTATFDVFY